MSNYNDLELFKNTYLEDSFVLEINEFNETLYFMVEIVLLEGHSFYQLPKKGEQYCYRTGKIVFHNLNSLQWVARNMRPFTDANDSEDFGNIDIFQLTLNGYHMAGDWGEVNFCADPPKIEWVEPG